MCDLKVSIPPYSDVPFHFIETGINVYSFEELLFHCYHKWKESLSDLKSGGVSLWVKDTLGLAFIAAQIDRLMTQDAMLSEKYLKFLSLEGYFDEDELLDLEHEIAAWENKSELEKLKQQGDERLYEKDYEKAVYYYEKLLNYGESAAIHNNIGCCYMKLGRFLDAEEHLRHAAMFDKRNAKIKLNTAMLYLLGNRESEARVLLLELEKTDNDRDVQYYLGDLELRCSDLKRAAEYFTRSAKMGNTADAYAALCKISLKTEDYEGARGYLEKIEDKTSSQYLENMAKINYITGDMKAALENAEQLLVRYFNNPAYWALAAKLYRETGDIEKAAASIAKAAEFDETNDAVIFESAKIKKALGKTLEYQSLLSRIVERWSSRYRLSS